MSWRKALITMCIVSKLDRHSERKPDNVKKGVIVRAAVNCDSRLVIA